MCGVVYLEVRAIKPLSLGLSLRRSLSLSPERTEKRKSRKFAPAGGLPSPRGKMSVRKKQEQSRDRGCVSVHFGFVGYALPLSLSFSLVILVLAQSVSLVVHSPGNSRILVRKRAAKHSSRRVE